jgi:hypothetical protein
MENLNLIVPIPQNNQTSPIIIHQDNSTFLTNIILDESNYPLWSQLIEMHIDARNKTGYFTGEAKKPKPKDPKFATWITKSQKVKSVKIIKIKHKKNARILNNLYIMSA